MGNYEGKEYLKIQLNITSGKKKIYIPFNVKIQNCTFYCCNGNVIYYFYTNMYISYMSHSTTKWTNTKNLNISYFSKCEFFLMANMIKFMDLKTKLQL